MNLDALVWLLVLGFLAWLAQRSARAAGSPADLPLLPKQPAPEIAAARAAPTSATARPDPARRASPPPLPDARRIAVVQMVVLGPCRALEAFTGPSRAGSAT
jgi:hypothetical protein